MSFRRLPLLLLGGLALLSTLGTSPAYPDALCGRADQTRQTCTTFHAELGADDVTLSGNATLPGHAGVDAGRSGTGKGAGNGSPSDTGVPARPPGSSSRSSAFPPGSQVVVRDNYTVTSAPTVRLSDLVHFRPAPPAAHMEPNGWAVAHLDANFFATASRQVQHGLLLGRAASVRFTPVSYRWDYGDGATRVTSAPGAAWLSSGLTEFSPTLTSHVYRMTRSYAVSLTVDFAAEYRFAGMPWTRLSGVVASRAPALVVVVTNAKTLLVADGCRAVLGSPGC